MAFIPTPRVKNALDNKKLNLSIRCPGTKEADKAWSSLIWGIYANNPRITVYTNDPADIGESRGFGKISANLDGPIFFAFLNILQRVIDSEGECKYKIENKNYTFPQGKRSAEPMIVSELHAGKDADGTIWISVTSFDKARPRIKFPITPSTLFHKFMHGDGTVLSVGELCKLYAQGYVNLLQGMMINMMTDNWVEPEAKAAPAGRGGYNNNNRGGGGGGNSGRNDDSADGDDLPF